jgi:hypothetical protein
MLNWPSRESARTTYFSCSGTVKLMIGNRKRTAPPWIPVAPVTVTNLLPAVLVGSIVSFPGSGLSNRFHLRTLGGTLGGLRQTKDPANVNARATSIYLTRHCRKFVISAFGGAIATRMARMGILAVSPTYVLKLKKRKVTTPLEISITRSRLRPHGKLETPSPNLGIGLM